MLRGRAPASIAVFLACCFLASAAGPVAPHGPVWLGAAGGKSGWAVASLGDLNGDGWGDFAVGDPNTGNGRVDVYLGSPDGPPTEASLMLTGARVGEQFGYALTAVGDADGDGAPELAVGAPLAPGMDPDAARAGRVFVFLSSDVPASQDGWAPSLTIVGDASDDRFGTALAGGSDLDGDGVQDLIASAPQALGTAGRVAIVPLSARGVASMSSLAVGLVEGSALGDELGETGLAVRGASWLVGAQEADPGGAAYLLRGAPTGRVDHLATRAWRGSAGEGLGFDVAFGGEGGVILGAPGAFSGSGAAYVAESSSGEIATTVRGFAGGATGTTLAWGDFDGDGVGDLLLGAPVATRATSTPGGLALILGPLPLGVINAADRARIFGDVNSGRFGFAVDIVPSPDDVHPAGILVGAPRRAPQAHLLLNHAPIATAHDQTVPCTGLWTNVTLAGTGSHDPDGDEDLVSFAWQDTNGIPKGVGRWLNVSLPVGDSSFVLAVRDVFDAQDTAVSTVSVVDVSPPDIRFERLAAREVYLEDEVLLTLPVPQVQFATQVGHGTYRVAAHDACSGVERVEFYVNATLVFTDREAPYEWERDPHVLLPAFDRVRALAYDGAGQIGETCLPVLDAGWVSLHHLPLLADGPPPVDEWGSRPREIIGAGPACEDEWILPVLDEPIPIGPPTGATH